MASAVEFLDQLKVDIDTNAVLKIHGYRDDSKQKSGINEIVAREIEAAQQLVQPKVIYREVEVSDMKEDVLSLEGDLSLHVGRKIAGWWHGSQSLAIAVCTIGEALEERVLALSQKEEHAAALTLDIAGSVAVDSMINHIRHFICEKASNLGIKVGPVISPGYGEWPLTDQRVLFSIMPAEDIGVHLNDQLMMIPKKSVSFCVGLGISKTLKEFNRCKYCDLYECPYRRVE